MLLNFKFFIDFGSNINYKMFFRLLSNGILVILEFEFCYSMKEVVFKYYLFVLKKKYLYDCR